MKHIIFLLCLVLSISAFSQVKVNGYYKSNGTYVAPHYRSSPDGNPYNNYSFPGNVNPYTGKVATGNPDTYLNRYNNRRRKSDSYYPGSGGYYASDAAFSFDLGYQVTTNSFAGGYFIFGVNNVTFGFETGGGNDKYYRVENTNLSYDAYWAMTLGYKGFYAGLGESLMYDYSYSSDINDLLVTSGYHTNIKHLSLKFGLTYSQSIKLGGSLGVGVKFY